MLLNPAPTFGRAFSFKQRFDAAAQLYGKSRAALGLKLLSLYWRHGFRPGESISLGLADPHVTGEALQGCFAKSELLKLQDRLNPPELTSLTEDKSVFAAYCAKNQVPVPMHFATIGRSGGQDNGAPGLASREEWLGEIVPRLPSSVIIKPALGVYGEGVSAWTRNGDGFRDHAGRCLSGAELYDLYSANPKYDRYVVQQRLLNAPSIVALTGSTSLQTVRLVTLIDADDQARCLYAEWKLVVGDNITDNYCSGRTGNLAASVALADGAVGLAQAPEPSGVGFREMRSHPVTGAPLEGYRLPDWTKVLDLAIRCANVFRPLRTIGWDIALTPEGPVIVEGNRWWDPPNEAVIARPAPGLDGHELIANSGLLRAAAMRGGR